MAITLRGFVYSKYTTISAFADAIGWKRGKASRIISGIQQPSRKDMEEMISLLDISKTDVAPLFFGSMFTE